jgi:hypothetical protein
MVACPFDPSVLWPNWKGLSYSVLDPTVGSYAAYHTGGVLGGKQLKSMLWRGAVGNRVVGGVDSRCQIDS